VFLVGENNRRITPVADSVRKTEFELGKQKVTIESGAIAKQANGAVLVTSGETVVLVAAVSAGHPKAGADFLPLTVDYRERTYAAGRIPGGFFKREGKARDNEILTSRLIDRSIRPLFPEGFTHDCQISAVVLSSDGITNPDILCMIGASAALHVSDMPFQGPIGAVRIGRINGELVVNPAIPEEEELDLDIVIAGSADALSMVEGGANNVPESVILDALTLAQQEIRKICEAQQQLLDGQRKPTLPWKGLEIPEELRQAVEELGRSGMREAAQVQEKGARDAKVNEVKAAAKAQLAERFPEKELVVNHVLENILYEEVRQLILVERRRTDGRGFEDIRPLASRVGVLPRTHGSALFTRGQTQALVTVTLGTPSDMQIMDELEGEYKERFLFHYNFPGFSTGEPKGDRGPGRREIGHGALAKRSLYAMLPDEESFPYTIRIVSDILESNGSSSMASVCGGALALLDAGVPLQSPVAGIAMGLVKEGDKYAILTDIQGLEDHLGDMDFKVAGTREGVTGIQMDIKISGLSVELLREALEQARVARMKLLDHMDGTIAEPRTEMSVYAPRMVTVQIPVDKIGALIGPGGKNIRRIIEETGAEVEVEDDGSVFISSTDSLAVERAKAQVEGLTVEAQVGKIYKGRVTRIMGIGVFVEILPGKEGLVRMNQLADRFVEKAEDVVKEGEEIEVKVLEVDQQGRVNLSRKAVTNPGSENEPGSRGGGGFRGGSRDSRGSGGGRFGRPGGGRAHEARPGDF
jgi:polyribonucleotide nucleotidyltransferase